MQRFPMTQEGYQKALSELKNLKEVVRKQVIDEIEEARSHGDLSENAEYDAAKERQGFTEARIRELEYKINLAQVIDTSKLQGDRIVFGATVTISDLDSGDEQTWRIVGDEEADPKAQRLSVSSPLARALIGKELGDEVKFQTPRGLRSCEVVHVRYE